MLVQFGVRSLLLCPRPSRLVPQVNGPVTCAKGMSRGMGWKRRLDPEAYLPNKSVSGMF